MKQQKMLSTQNLTIGYRHDRRQTTLFEDLNLELHAGQLVCFMGPNGIGKSSLIRTLAQLQPPLGGSVILGEKNSKTPEVISVVLTDGITTSNMTVYDLITFGRYPYVGWNVRLTDNDKAIIDRSISQVHIQELKERKLSELSDGQMQMVMIARAFAQDTPVILLDEPTAHLDLNNRVEIMKLLKSLSRSTNKAILVSTHELDLALQMADLIWLANRNRNILKGIPEDLVLQGAFDAIFQFKGFDLKTGKVQHEVFRSDPVSLAGEGPEYLWTKNALERNGYQVTLEKQNIEVIVLKQTEKPDWIVRKNGEETRFSTLSSLLNYL